MRSFKKRLRLDPGKGFGVVECSEYRGEVRGERVGFEGGVESRVLSVGPEGREGLCKWKAEEGCG